MKSFLKGLVAPVLSAVLVALLVATGTNAYVWQWSQTASSNSTADPAINWAEGMSPSSVNDSARAMMGMMARWRDDISGKLATGGTASAYTLTTNSSIGSVPEDGQMLAFTPHATNDASATMRVDGGTTYPLQTASGVAVGANTIVVGTPYRMKFNNSASAWILEAVYGSPFDIPVGAVLPYAGSTAPNANFALAYGQCISRSTYAALFALLATTYGACDGTTTFGLPDLRGRLAAGVDNMGGSAASRMTNASTGCGVAWALGAACGTESHTLTTAQIPSHTHNNTLNDPGHSHTGRTSEVGGTGAQRVLPPSSGGIAATVTDSTTTGITISNASAGGGGAHPNVQPSIALSYIIRIQ